MVDSRMKAVIEKYAPRSKDIMLQYVEVLKKAEKEGGDGKKEKAQ